MKIETVKEKIALAIKDNREDLINAENNDDFKEISYCEGFEDALLYILSLLNSKGE